jgi:DNA-binding CsgD family transcriptional regulator/tetratricopeptide (TPR) repeat protein
MLVALGRGLVEDGLVHVEAGRADLLDTRIPRRVGDLARDRLARLSAPARQAAAVASILGERISFDHLSTMLEVAPATLLGPLDELVVADVLVASDERFGFPDELVRRSVLEGLDPSVRHALQRQAIDVLLAAGSSPLEPAVSLAANARIGDRATIATLVAASRAVGRTDPVVASELSRRALELTPAGDEGRPPVIAEMARQLHAAGRAAEARAAAGAALRQRLSPEHEAALQLTVAEMADLPPDLRIAAGEAALARTGLPATWAARHLAALVANLALSGRSDDARALLAQASDAVAVDDEPGAVLTLAVAEARLLAQEGAHAEALRCLDAAHAAGPDAAGADRRLVDPLPAELLRADLLLALDRHDPAHLAGVDGRAAAQRHHHTSAARSWQRFLGRSLLQIGHLAEAVTTLGATLEADHAVETVDDAATLDALGRIAVHTGDQRRASDLARLAEGVVTTGVPEARRHAAWFLVHHAMATGDLDLARAHLAQVGADGTGAARPLVAGDVTDAPRLVRLALALGDDELARLTVAAAEERTRRNPGVDSIAAAVAHARGLLTGDAADLGRAADLLAGGPRQLARASALEDLGRHLAVDATHTRGVDALSHALQIYTHVGAAWDASRVRQHLRTLGIRRRLTKSTRPTTGWPSLTDAETAVAELVAQGLTNRVVAQRLYLSPHTVSMHLRHIFTKLDINTRVELTRLAFQHQQAA